MTRRVLRSIGLLAILFGLPAGDAAAQVTDWVEKFREWQEVEGWEEWQPEPRPQGWSVTPSLGLGLFRDSNAPLVVQRPGSSDVAALVQPRADLTFLGRRTNFRLGYSGSLQTFRSIDYLNRYTQRAGIGASRVLSRRLSVRADASFLMTPTTDEVRDGTIPFAAVGSRSGDASAAVHGVLSPRTRVTAAYRVHRLQYMDPDGPELALAILRGGSSQSPSIQLTHDATRRLSLQGTWAYTRGIVAGDVGAFGMQHVDLLGSYALRAETTIGVGGGATLVSAPAVDVEGWRPTVHVFVEQEAGPNTLAISYRNTIVPAFSLGGLSREQEVRATVGVPLLLGRWYLRGSLALSRVRSLEGVGLGTNTSTMWVEGTAGYRLSRWLSAEAFAQTARQRALAHSDYGVQRLRLGIQFVAAQSKRMQ